ncbi:MAG: helix-turn-helix domain-containing protein [Oscillospiraceae bacterium]|nr:helix-turn-helix domain-containing protein [Oscillospiraceae bacterium]
MLGARIALLRRQAGLSQRALAAALQVSPSAVGMYEQERRVPSTALLVEMARLFGVTTDFLLTGSAAAADAPRLLALTDRIRKPLRTQDGNPLSRTDAALLLNAVLTAGELTDAEKSAIMEKTGGGETMTDEELMRQALALAKEAAADGEVPVGCVITDGERIVGRGRNRREKGKNALYHAELEAINEACCSLGGWRLWRCTMYVTLEPCPMCAGAIINARIARLVYGAPDARAGSCGTLTDLFALPYNHRPEVTRGVLEEDCAAVLQEFFRKLRENPPVKTWKKPEERNRGNG